jgi:hypothetical protein
MAVLAAVALTAIALIAGLRNGPTADVDEVVFQRTLHAMATGRGYYPSMRDALIAKDGKPPSSARALRLPTLFLGLYKAPERSWRWLVGIPVFATLLLAWRLARPWHAFGGLAGVVLAGCWMVAATPLLYLHLELWGVPLLLAGVLMLRRGRDGSAAWSLAAATGLRELYALALVVGVASRRRWRWLPAVVGVVALLVTHFVLAARVTSASGYEPPLGTDHYSVRYVLSMLSPADRPVAWLVGLACLALGFAGLQAARSVGRDSAAQPMLVYVAVMVPTAVLLGRSYWSLTFGPLLACYVPAVALWFDREESIARDGVGPP